MPEKKKRLLMSPESIRKLDEESESRSGMEEERPASSQEEPRYSVLQRRNGMLPPLQSSTSDKKRKRKREGVEPTRKKQIVTDASPVIPPARFDFVQDSTAFYNTPSTENHTTWASSIAQSTGTRTTTMPVLSTTTTPIHHTAPPAARNHHYTPTSHRSLFIWNPFILHGPGRIEWPQWPQEYVPQKYPLSGFEEPPSEDELDLEEEMRLQKDFLSSEDEDEETKNRNLETVHKILDAMDEERTNQRMEIHREISNRQRRELPKILQTKDDDPLFTKADDEAPDHPPHDERTTPQPSSSGNSELVPRQTTEIHPKMEKEPLNSTANGEVLQIKRELQSEVVSIRPQPEFSLITPPQRSSAQVRSERNFEGIQQRFTEMPLVPHHIHIGGEFLAANGEGTSVAAKKKKEDPVVIVISDSD